MAEPSSVRMALKNVPFRYLLNYFSMVETLAIDLHSEDFERIRALLQGLGFLEEEIQSTYDRYKRPVTEALHEWQGTVGDLYGALKDSRQKEALDKLFSSLAKNVYDIHRYSPRTWDDLLASTSYRISPNVSRLQFYRRMYVIPIWYRIVGFIYMLFPFNTSYALDMYRAISNVINKISFVISCLTIAQNAYALYYEGRLYNLMTIVISFSLWIKLYLMEQPLNQLRALLPCGSDSQKFQRANFLYKQIRIALLFVFSLKLFLALIGGVLYFAYPEFKQNLQSQMTQLVMVHFAIEVVHNAFYFYKFYRYSNICRIMGDLFPKQRCSNIERKI